MSSRTNNPATWRFTTQHNIPYRLKSIEGSSSWDESSVTETYILASQHVLLFILESFPIGRVVNGLPIVNPRACPGASSLLTRRISWRALDSGKPIDPFLTDPFPPKGTYGDLVEVTIEYDNQRKQQEVGNLLLEVSANVAGEFLHVSAPKGAWESPGVPNQAANVPINVLIAETEWTVQWDHVPRVFFRDTLLPKLRKSLGRVNSADFSLLFNAKPETVLFVGFDMTERFFPTALIGNKDEVERGKLTAKQKREQLNLQEREDSLLPPVKVTLKFLEKHVDDGGPIIRGHNDFWNQDVGWQRLLFNGTEPIYKSVNFNNLFVPDTGEEF